MSNDGFKNDIERAEHVALIFASVVTGFTVGVIVWSILGVS